MRERVAEQEGRGERVGRGEGGHFGRRTRASEIECAIIECFWKGGNGARGGKRCWVLRFGRVLFSRTCFQPAVRRLDVQWFRDAGVWLINVAQLNSL